MALGGGTFITQNKKLPGAYINFISAARATASLSERGVVAMPLVLDWGEEGAVMTVSQADFIRDCQKIFGYEYTHEKMKGLRDLFKNASTLYAYRLGSGTKAANTYATAKYAGVRGNDIKIVIAANVDDSEKFDVKTYLGTTLMDSQVGVADMAALKDNDYVVWKRDATLAITASTPLSDGANATAISGQDWQNALAALESYSFNVLGCVSTTDTVKDLCIAYTKRMRDEAGVKFQCVVYKKNTADYEGAISVENKLEGEDSTESASLVYWVTGAEAGCAVNKSCTNKVYDGEFAVDTNYTQIQLETALDNGKLIFHKVGQNVRILEDINTLVNVTEEKGEDFKNNQTIRVIDQIGNDIAVLFNEKYLGVIPNNRSGRISLWNDIVKHHQELQSIQAIEDFESEDVIVSQGNEKKAVVVDDGVTPVNAMAKLYMTCVIS